MDELNKDRQHRLRDRTHLKVPNFYQACCIEPDEPQTYEEAMASREADQWQQVIKEEESAVVKNHTWTKEKLLSGQKVITAKIIFKKKHGADGEVNRYKARFVVRGFSERPGIDYTETYAPVIRYESIRFLLSLAAKEDFEMAQFDIKTAFLNDELNENVYMELPIGMTNAGDIVNLHKSLYGLKQSPRGTNYLVFSVNITLLQAGRCVYKGEVERCCLHSM